MAAEQTQERLMFAQGILLKVNNVIKCPIFILCASWFHSYDLSIHLIPFKVKGVKVGWLCRPCHHVPPSFIFHLLQIVLTGYLQSVGCFKFRQYGGSKIFHSGCPISTPGYLCIQLGNYSSYFNLVYLRYYSIYTIESVWFTK